MSPSPSCRFKCCNHHQCEWTVHLVPHHLQVFPLIPHHLLYLIFTISHQAQVHSHRPLTLCRITKFPTPSANHPTRISPWARRKSIYQWSISHPLHDHTLDEQYLPAKAIPLNLKTPHPTLHWTKLCESSNSWPEMEECHVWWVNSPNET